MNTVLRTLSLAVSVAASCAAMAEPITADITVTPPPGGGFVVKSQAGSADGLRVTGNGSVYLPELPGSTEASNVACYDNAGRLAKCASSALSGSLPWARSVASAPNMIAIPILVINTPSVLGAYGVTVPQAGNYTVNWLVNVQPPLALVGITCGVYVNGTLVPVSQTQQYFNQSVLAPVPVQGSALVTGLQAGDIIAPGCASNLLGTVMTSARNVVQQVGEAQLIPFPP